MSATDTQVKLRGFRIELGEIESKALNIEGIRQAAAEVRKVMGNEHLVLYYTLESNSTLTDEDIRKTLAASSLAEYMVPDAYMQMDTMPMTPNGKINRKVLPIPEMKRVTEYEAPENALFLLFRTNGSLSYNLGGNRKVRSIESTNDYTTQVLYRMGFQWPPTAADYVHRFVDTIVGFDYFTV